MEMYGLWDSTADLGVAKDLTLLTYPLWHLVDDTGTYNNIVEKVLDQKLGAIGSLIISWSLEIWDKS